ncbi:MAG: hypothetical protein ACRC2S_14295 [Waterburya sp.]
MEPINWSQAQLSRQATAGQVVAQKIREDKTRLTKLASENNGSSVTKITPVETTTLATANEDIQSQTVTNSNSIPVELEPEKLKADS